MDRRRFDEVLQRGWGSRLSPDGAVVALPRGYSGMIGWRWRSGECEWVLKGQPAERISQEQLAWVHGLCRHAGQRGIRWLPQPLVRPTGQTVYTAWDRCWEVQEALPGAAHQPQERMDRTRLTQVIQTLARLHFTLVDYAPEVALKAAPVPAVRVRLRRLEEYQSQLAQLQREVSRRRDGDEEQCALAQRVLERFSHEAAACYESLRAVAELSMPMGPCLRDVRPGDILWVEDELSGFVDPTAAGIDFPFIDAIRLVGEIEEMPLEWPEIIEIYARAYPLPAGVDRLIGPLLESSRWISVLNWIQWGVVQPRRGVSPEQVKERIRQLARRLGIV